MYLQFAMHLLSCQRIFCERTKNTLNLKNYLTLTLKERIKNLIFRIALFLQISDVETQYIRTIDNLIVSRIALKMQLQAVHFSSVNSPNYNRMYGQNSVYEHGGLAYPSNQNPGGLLLRCSAQIGDLYQEYKEIELGTPQKDPIPARGKLP